MTEQQITAIEQAGSAVREAIDNLYKARFLLISEDTAPTISDRIKDVIFKVDDIADDLADYPEEHTQYMKHLASLGFTWEAI